MSPTQTEAPAQQYPNHPPDNDYFEHSLISWNVRSPEGWSGTMGAIKDGFDQTFGTPESGERIWLDEATPGRELTIQVLGEDGTPESTHILRGKGSIVHIMGGRTIRVTTPEGQGNVGYMCDYPGTRPDETLH